MRLGQFARKYDIRVQDIVSFLEKESEEIHSNTKLSDEDENEILDFFGIEKEEEPIVEVESIPAIIEKVKEEPALEEVEEKSAEDEDAWIEEDSPKEELVFTKSSNKEAASPLDDIASVEGEIEFGEPERINNEVEDIEEEVKDVAPVEQVKDVKPEPKEDEIIDTERLMELLESEEASPDDLNKIKLIKAPKKELSGLKVVGKVDLPEPKKKEVSEEDAEENQAKNQRQQRAQLSEEEKEKRRLRAKRKKEEFEAREAKRRKEKEEKERIARNAIHYKRKLATAQPKKKKQKAKKQVPVSPAPITTTVEHKEKVKKEQPKSAFGKMWKWLTNPD